MWLRISILRIENNYFTHKGSKDIYDFAYVYLMNTKLAL